jgi:hypothetical protein
VTLPAIDDVIVRTLHLERDLRDVVLTKDGHLMVTTFRRTDLLFVAEDGTFSNGGPIQRGLSATPDVARRTLALPDGGLAMVHQMARLTKARAVSGGYGGTGDPCDDPPIVSSAVTLSVPTELSGGGTMLQPQTVQISGAVLPVDLAVRSAGDLYAMVAPGNAHNGMSQLFLLTRKSFHGPGDGCPVPAEGHTVPGEAVSVAFDGHDRVVVQSREPASLLVRDTSGNWSEPISLSDVSRADTGHAIFHSNAGGFIACASCHAEGGDDAQVWNIEEDGTTNPRRTPSLRGTVGGTAPYHWDGRMTDIGMLVANVLVERMSGPELLPDQLAALQSWLVAIPAPGALTTQDAAAIARGQTLFTDPAIGCSGCHAGPKHTNNLSLDVGTGDKFQVPPLLGVAWRAPYLHDGCAATL